MLLSMAPPDSLPVLREALAMGADRAVLLSDKAFAGSDTLITARILAEGIRHIGSFNLICCGNYTLDGFPASVVTLLDGGSTVELTFAGAYPRNALLGVGLAEDLHGNIGTGMVTVSANPEDLGVVLPFVPTIMWAADWPRGTANRCRISS